MRQALAAAIALVASCGHARPTVTGAALIDGTPVRKGQVLTSGEQVFVVEQVIYGAATCDFPGCKYVFGVPIVFLAGAALIYFGRD